MNKEEKELEKTTQNKDTSTPKEEKTQQTPFVRGDWKLELTPEELEKKKKRSEAAKKAQETRKLKKQMAEKAAQEAKEQLMQRVPDAEKLAVKDTEKPVEKTAVKDIEKPTEKVVVETAEKPVAKDIEKPTEKVVVETAEKPVKKSAIKNIKKPAEKPVAKNNKKTPEKSDAANTAKAPKKETQETQETPSNLQFEQEYKTLNISPAKETKKSEKSNKNGETKAKENKPSFLSNIFKKAEKVKKTEKAEKAEVVEKIEKAVEEKPTKVEKPLQSAKAEKIVAEKPLEEKPQKQLIKQKPQKAEKVAKPATVKIENVEKTQRQDKKSLVRRVANKKNLRRRFLRTKLMPMLYAFEDFFYEIGFFVEYGLVGVIRFSKKLSIYLTKVFAKSLGTILKPFKLFVLAAWHIVADPAVRIYSGIVNIKTVIKDEKEKGWKVAAKEAGVYFKRGIKDYRHLVSNLIMWSIAVVCLGVFAYTVSTTLSQDYVLELSVDSKFVGYVQNEETFEQAKADIQRQLVYTNDAEKNKPWDISPKYKVTTLGSNHVFQPDQIVTSILRTSGKDIVQATGFYVDGQFYGATTDRLQLEQDIESFKAPYMDGDADSTVEFVQNVELVDGVYIADSVVEYSDISKLLYSTKQGEVNYTVKNGDTLSGIASENGITQNELIALNPQLAESKAMFHPGDIFVMSKAQAFLQVKVVKRIVEQVEIPFASTQSQSGDLGFGKRQVMVEGVKGLKDVTSDLTYIDGVMVDKTLVQEVIVSEPVTEEVVIGTYIAPGVVAVPGTGQMMWPVPGYKYVSRGFAGQFPAHNGLDICAGYGTPIYASDNGVVTKAAYTGVGYGVHVIINHGNGLVSLYAHCSSLAVTTGQTVTKGQIIGYIGSTGWSTGNHCHYEISNGSTRFNPMNYF